VLPTTDAAPMDIATPEQLLVFAMVAAAGNGFTLMITEFDLIHPVAVIVSVTV
jgi:hypothetical protein